MARKCYIKDLKIKLQEKSKIIKTKSDQKLHNHDKKGLFLTFELVRWQSKFTTAPCCSGQLISVNTPAAAPHSVEVIKNRENKRFMNGSCREHVYIFPNSA